ncbi:hypothetical protein AB0C33_44950 [Nonomuraea sp. NPDC048881]|uniref:hypothetical protein n=1 Tax=Nonomuraea sp. NPDC048881 TaxID=3155030 RepID=UPI0033DD1FA7
MTVHFAGPLDRARAGDLLVPTVLGGVLTEQIVPELRCAAIAGPANNQLATPDVADLLHRRGIVWVPDYVVNAGGVINAITMELHHGTALERASASRPSRTPSPTSSTRRTVSR